MAALRRLEQEKLPGIMEQLCAVKTQIKTPA